MSNEHQSTSINVSQTTPSAVPSAEEMRYTIERLAARLDLLERGSGEQSSMDTTPTGIDDAIQERTPDRDFLPYTRFREALPSLQKDFFRSQMPEADRRKFLSECPRNLERIYQPPPLNSVAMGHASKRYDAQLSDVQYRLSGLTRPMDFFLHRVLTQESVTVDEAVDFINVMHELLMDTASHVTQLRIDNMYRGAGIQGQAPRLLNCNPAPLVDTKELLDHVNLQRSWSSIGRRPKRGKANSTSDQAITDHSPRDSNHGVQHKAPQVQLGGRLHQFQQAWDRLTDERWVRSIIQHGFKIPFSTPPPLSLGICSKQPHHNQKEYQAIEDEIIQLLAKNAIEPASGSWGFHSHLFTIPKKTGERRPVLNLRPLNQFVQRRHFKMETLKTTCQMINTGDYLTSIDLSDAFLHVLIHHASRRYLRFQWENNTFQFRVLPFGLSLSPLVFTKILRPVLKWARRKGIRLAAYLDDILIVAKDQATSKNHTHLVLSKLRELGFLVKLSKSSLIPQQQIQHLGFQIDSAQMTLKVPKEKVRDLRRDALRMLHTGKSTIRQVASFVGKAQSLTAAVFPARLKSRYLMMAKNQALRHTNDWSHACPLTPLAIQELEWWRDKLSQWNGLGLLPVNPQYEIYTDASQSGWGIVCNQRIWSQSWNATELPFHINYKELLVIWKVVQLRQFQGKILRIYCDNTTTIAYVNKFGGTISPLLTDLATKIWDWCLKTNTRLTLAYVPTHFNPADSPSRRLDAQLEWQISKEYFNYLNRRWGPHQVCHLASASNSNAHGRSIVPVDQPRSSICLSTLEPYHASHQQSTSRTHQHDVDHTAMDVGNVVPYDTLINQSSSTDSTSPSRTSSARPRSPSAPEEPSLAVSGLGLKMRRLTAEGVDERALTIIASAQGRTQARKDNLQDRYIRWCLSHSCNPQSPASLVNFLADARITRGLAASTLQAYRSTLLDLFEDRQAAASSAPLQTFLQAINSQTVRQEKNTSVDINPVTHHFRNLGSNSLLPIAQLTSKLCWLLGVCGFLRASDIERICLDASDWQSHPNKLILVVVGPKEKRSGQRVRRTVYIDAHPETALCPVSAFRTYVARHASFPCRKPHPWLEHVTINYLMRHVHDHSKPLFAQRINNHIKRIMALLPASDRHIRARALGATRAVLAGASVDEIVAHGHWSSKTIFNEFYRLSTESRANFTALTLNTSDLSPALNSQSMDPPSEV
ncbi:hypothetical protein INT44_004868 [Umbelopsis vinacea]|uniref:Reverse transcriptase domain-containing protein n=1 Tax=Umbelopsis vinacea TaxID=44442 RepID=A0A8H7Q7F9_9FUNG|nr:hypothetical protein INT44_004868 [Umbelopsis vinacea]